MILQTDVNFYAFTEVDIDFQLHAVQDSTAC